MVELIDLLKGYSGEKNDAPHFKDLDLNHDSHLLGMRQGECKRTFQFIEEMQA